MRNDEEERFNEIEEQRHEAEAETSAELAAPLDDRPSPAIGRPSGERHRRGPLRERGRRPDGP